MPLSTEICRVPARNARHCADPFPTFGELCEWPPITAAWRELAYRAAARDDCIWITPTQYLARYCLAAWGPKAKPGDRCAS